MLRMVRKRLPEWRAAVASESRKAGLGRLLVQMAWTAVFGLVRRPRISWRRKIRICRRCPVYDYATRKCRLPDTNLGCGCYVPFLAIFVDSCWADERFQAEGGGWMAQSRAIITSDADSSAPAAG